MHDSTEATDVPVLALRTKQAAAALGLSERKLWSLTAAGEVPHVRLGRCLVYPTKELELWLSSKVNGDGFK